MGISIESGWNNLWIKQSWWNGNIAKKLNDINPLINPSIENIVKPENELIYMFEFSSCINVERQILLPKIFSPTSLIAREILEEINIICWIKKYEKLTAIIQKNSLKTNWDGFCTWEKVRWDSKKEKA